MTEKLKQPAFLNLHEHGGYVSLWVNRTLLPSISTSLRTHHHHSLQDFSVACTQVYRRDITKYENGHCSIEFTNCDEVRQNSTKPISGASLTFHKDVLGAAGKAFMSSTNRAIGKIGQLFREAAEKKPL